MHTTQMQGLIDLLVVLGLLVLMVLPAAIGAAHDLRVDRRLRRAQEGRTPLKDQGIRKRRGSRKDRDPRAPGERRAAQKSSSRSTVPSTATWYADGRRSKKLVSS
ncbi:hypothetical protein GCM10009564_00320 [Streptomyces thermogriseus]|uniref:Secreted protein n=1 Tax=Streptomyces thermogriseus TaxID=75292 RepID=A0ABP4D9C0_9ACTN